MKINNEIIVYISIVVTLRRDASQIGRRAIIIKNIIIIIVFF